jgi:hypothetical protein
MKTDEPGMIWVKTDMPADESGFVVTLETDDDTARILTPADALNHASGILAAVARAEYDASVLRQMTEGLDLPLETAGQMVGDMRADRPPLDPALTAPIELTPGVNANLAPFLMLSLHGALVGQWTMADARSHALAVIEAATVADLDSAYFRTLVGMIGIDKGRARRTIDDLVNYRP